MSRLPEQRAYHRIPPRAHRGLASEEVLDACYRTGHTIGLHPVSMPYTTTQTFLVPPPTWEADEQEQDGMPTRPSTSTRRYVQVHDLRQSRQTAPAASLPVVRTTPQPTAASTRRLHWLFFLGLGMCLTLVVWIGGNLLLTWWQGYQVNQHYGSPRIFQCDAVVGHQDSPTHPSHFIALNLHGQIEVFELPGGDGTAVKVYAAPVLMGPNQDQAVVTLSFEDVNGDGKPDMIVAVQDTRFVFLNTGTAFRPSKPGDHISL